MSPCGSARRRWTIRISRTGARQPPPDRFRWKTIATQLPTNFGASRTRNIARRPRLMRASRPTRRSKRRKKIRLLILPRRNLLPTRTTRRWQQRPTRRRLEKFVREYSAHFRKYPFIYSSLVLVTAQRTRFHFLSTEGNHVVIPTAFVRVAIEAETRADDGMELMRVETFQAESMDHLPPPSEIAAKVEKMATDLKALREAPVAEPFDGPALAFGTRLRGLLP